MDKILKAREDNFNFMLEIFEKYKKTIIICRINYPGVDKNSENSEIAFENMRKKVTAEFSKNILYSYNKNSFDGKIFFGVLDLPPRDSKLKAVSLEEKDKLGRLFDIDIFHGDFISRKELNLPERRCFICDRNSRECMREHNHSNAEIENYVNKLIISSTAE